MWWKKIKRETEGKINKSSIKIKRDGILIDDKAEIGNLFADKLKGTLNEEHNNEFNDIFKNAMQS